MSGDELQRKLRTVIAIVFGMLTVISVIVALCGQNNDQFTTAIICAVVTIAALVD